MTINQWREVFEIQDVRKAQEELKRKQRIRLRLLQGGGLGARRNNVIHIRKKYNGGDAA